MKYPVPGLELVTEMDPFEQETQGNLQPNAS
jgi:hypothetical protein